MFKTAHLRPVPAFLTPELCALPSPAVEPILTGSATASGLPLTRETAEAVNTGARAQSGPR